MSTINLNAASPVTNNITLGYTILQSANIPGTALNFIFPSSYPSGLVNIMTCSSSGLLGWTSLLELLQLIVDLLSLIDDLKKNTIIVIQ